MIGWLSLTSRGEVSKTCSRTSTVPFIARSEKRLVLSGSAEQDLEAGVKNVLFGRRSKLAHKLRLIASSFVETMYLETMYFVHRFTQKGDSRAWNFGVFKIRLQKHEIMLL